MDGLFISVIIPALNEERNIQAAIESTKRTSLPTTKVEVIVVDGGSKDNTVRIAAESGAQIIQGRRGRGVQQGEGASRALGDFIFFLHGDSELPSGYDNLLKDSIDEIQRNVKHNNRIWGAFCKLSIKDGGFMLKVVEAGIWIRTRYFLMPYGDQCFFFHKDAYKHSGGFKNITFMEDYEMLHRQKTKKIKPLLLNDAVITSGRRWQIKGIIQTSILNQLIILAWHIGVQPEVLQSLYYK